MKMHLFMHALLSAAFFLFAAPAADASMLKHIIVIVMENKDAENSWGKNYIYGNTEKAPYINRVLMPKAARAKNFMDQLPGLPSEPHYIWMEAGTNRFSNSDEFVGDEDVPAHRSTTSKYHLAAQIEAANGPVPLTWMTYQEGISEATGKCPIENSKADSYVVRHNPFVYFRDVSGDPPSKTSAYCVAHTKPYSAFAGDLAANNIANYVFITPNLCNDMHNDCGRNRIKNGDDWLKAELPPVIEWANRNAAVIFITWDEGWKTSRLPFFAIGRGVKEGYVSDKSYTHGSIIRTVEQVFSLPPLKTVQNSSDLSDLFKAGAYP